MISRIGKILVRVPLFTTPLERFNFYRKIMRSPRIQFRRAVAKAYLTGDGIEIGALHTPLQLPKSARVRYVDYIDKRAARVSYPELRHHHLVDVDIIDEGETLNTIEATSLDFVIANHLLEHCQNPLLALETWLSKLKDGGTLFVTVPDKRFSFDINRDVTPLTHLKRDYEDGPAWSLQPHLEDWARNVAKVPENEVAAHAAHLLEVDYRIHFHVWASEDFLNFLLFCRDELRWPIELEAFNHNDNECVSVLRKIGHL